MSAGTRILVGTAIGAGLVAGYSYLRNMQRMQVQLETLPKVSINKVDLTGLTIRVDALLKNPTRFRFKVKFPYVRLSHKNVVLGSSQVINKDIQVPGYGEVMISGIMVQIPVISFFSVAYDIVKALQNKQPINLLIAVITTLDLGWARLPYESKTDIILKK